MTCELTLEEEEAKVLISTLRSKVGFGFSMEEEVGKGSRAIKLGVRSPVETLRKEVATSHPY